MKRQRTKAPLGQNYLSDPSAAEKIVEVLGDISQKMVVEIVPGKGALTGPLAKRAGKLIAIELDRTLTAKLRMAYARWPNVEVIEANVLSVDFDTIVQGELHGVTDRQNREPRKARVIGNLPYYITSDILLKLCEFHRNFDEIVIMVQKEVADRISAKPGSRDYGLLSATVQLYAEVDNLFTLPPGAFTPPPKVYSSVLRLQIAPQATKLGIEAEQFISFLKISFAQKRKTLANNLKSQFPDAEIREAIKQSKLRADVRAEAMPLEKMAELFKSLDRQKNNRG